jgi:hypothetical protein
MERRGGVIAKLVEFFEANPDEELTVQDVATKFGCSVDTAHSRISQAIAEGELIERVHVIRVKREVEA